MNLPVRADRTGCMHLVKTIEGIHQCSRCCRLFDEVDGVMHVGASKIAVEPVSQAEAEYAVLELGYLHLRYQQEQIRAMLPDLEENKRTKGVARKLRSILGDA